VKQLYTCVLFFSIEYGVQENGYLRQRRSLFVTSANPIERCPSGAAFHFLGIGFVRLPRWGNINMPQFSTKGLRRWRKGLRPLLRA